MIEIKLSDGVGSIEVRGSDELIECELSVLVAMLVTKEPKLFMNALINNLELLEKEVKS